MVAQPEVAWEKSMASNWNQKNPDLPWVPEDVSWENIFEKVLTYEKAGDPVDLGYGWSGFTADWHQMGIIDAPEDILGATWKDRYAEFARANDTIDGKLWAAPIQGAIQVLVCRRDWLTEVGVSDPLSITTWDKLLEVMDKVASKKGNKPFGVPLGNGRNADEKMDWVFRSNGLANLTDLGPDKKDAYIQVLEFLLQSMKYVSADAFSQDYVGHRQAFATGTAGFISIGSYYFGEIYDTAKEVMTKEHVVCIPYPSGPKGTGPILGSECNSYFLMKNSRNKQSAAKLVDFLTSPENLMVWSLGLPPLKEWTVDQVVPKRQYGEAERWWLEEHLALSKSVKVVPAKGFIAKDEIQQFYYENLVAMLKGQRKPADVYAAMADKVPALLKAAQKT